MHFFLQGRDTLPEVKTYRAKEYTLFWNIPIGRLIDIRGKNVVRRFGVRNLESMVSPSGWKMMESD
jgi:hypothetical protein